MVISSNTLFHFTNNIDNLFNILKNEFCPRYCLENFESVFTSFPKLKKLGVPMVSFCDLPLSSIEKHLECYGNYGIGMKKEWGLKNGLNPVIYLCAKSDLAKQFQKWTGIFHKEGEKRSNEEWTTFMKLLVS